MSPAFSDCINSVVRNLRGDSGVTVEYDPIVVEVNKMTLKFPHQMFIDGKFCNSSTGK